ncbi:DUF305 domain-containing protein [Pseudarthrobacter sp. PS3-L1]|nr:DUF305 domain-containing protein [Pseudarthrobacter sp. PS3-L1]MDJ0318938.1 DUF305 domain-containing protein [Pseudarthrobacter sp. PS3-L1]
MNKTLTLSSLALAGALALTGCAAGSEPGTSAASSSPTSMSGMDHGGGSMSANSAPASSAEYNSADAQFAQLMIPHHAQAVQMSETILKKDRIPASVTDLATKIKAEQGPEINLMTGWLQSWGQPTDMATGMASGMGMSGMMSDEEMGSLDAATGTEAAKLYLSQMVGHHEGAIEMAKKETTDGKNAEAVQLSKDIVSSQEKEIQEMKDLIATL